MDFILAFERLHDMKVLTRFGKDQSDERTSSPYVAMEGKQDSRSAILPRRRLLSFVNIYCPIILESVSITVCPLNWDIPGPDNPTNSAGQRRHEAIQRVIARYIVRLYATY